MTIRMIDRDERAPAANGAAEAAPGGTEPTVHVTVLVPSPATRRPAAVAPRALVLEDDESVATTLAAILAGDGFLVRTAASVAEALAALDQTTFDVALLDLALEDGDGLTVLRRLHDTAPETIALILTGYGSFESAVQAMRSGARAYLLKPCSVPDLRTMIAEELEIRRRAEAVATRRHLAFLSEASQALAASLDHEATLATVVQLAVPRLTEWSMVYLVGDDGGVRRVAAAHADPAKDELMQQLVHRFPISLDASHPVRRAMRSGMSLVTPEVRPEEVDRYATEPEHARILRELAIRSAAIVPLIARGQTLGALSFAPTGTRAGGLLDLAVVEDLARRAALAIDNARLYRQAQEAVRARDEFLGSASHDLRTPLTNIKVQAQLLRRRLAALPNEQRQQLATGLASIEGSTTRMAVQINELLDIAQLRTGQELVLHGRRLDLVDLVGRVAGDVQALTTVHTVRMEAAAPELVGEWDGFRLERVVGNLLSNAVKFSPDGGEVQVTIGRDAEDALPWAVVSVRDHGIGIPADDLPHVFERFQRAQNTRGRIPGIGIGLAGAKQIVERHGGTISVESVEGSGSTFTVRLPLRPPAEYD